MSAQVWIRALRSQIWHLERLPTDAEILALGRRQTLCGYSWLREIVVPYQGTTKPANRCRACVDGLQLELGVES